MLARKIKAAVGGGLCVNLRMVVLRAALYSAPAPEAMEAVRIRRAGTRRWRTFAETRREEVRAEAVRNRARDPFRTLFTREAAAVSPSWYAAGISSISPASGAASTPLLADAIAEAAVR